MKAARNARQRLLPLTIKAKVIATAKELNKARTVERPQIEGKGGRSKTVAGGIPDRPTDKQVKLLNDIYSSKVWKDEERKALTDWLASPAATKREASERIEKGIEESTRRNALAEQGLEW
jgi:hypothetical protein